jgi:hypothetical protein
MNMHPCTFLSEHTYGHDEQAERGKAVLSEAEGYVAVRSLAHALCSLSHEFSHTLHTPTQSHCFNRSAACPAVEKALSRHECFNHRQVAAEPFDYGGHLRVSPSHLSFSRAWVCVPGCAG